MFNSLVAYYRVLYDMNQVASAMNNALPTIAAAVSVDPAGKKEAAVMVAPYRQGGDPRHVTIIGPAVGGSSSGSSGP